MYIVSRPRPLLEDVAQAQAHVRAIAVGSRIGEGRVVVAGEAEAAVVGAHDVREKALGLRALQLEARIGADPHRDVRRLEAAVGVALVVRVRRETDLDAFAEPIVALRAHRQRVELLEARRVLVAHDEMGLVAA